MMDDSFDMDLTLIIQFDLMHMDLIPLTCDDVLEVLGQSFVCSEDELFVIDNEDKIAQKSVSNKVSEVQAESLLLPMLPEVISQKIQIVNVEVPKSSGFFHKVAVPVNTSYTPLSPIVEPVRTYKFTLDAFQERAITCIDNYQSLLVSAHASAGKTSVAEYAITKGLENKKCVIYTTPIKTLSHQKYGEFYENFKEQVGVITRDVSIDSSVCCLIMTIKILRNMLYRGSEIMKKVDWVIFDEAHYMGDKELGRLYEETLILLPKSTRQLFLSATIPNAVEFAQWIAQIHSQPCHLIVMDHRSVPLQHYLHPVGGEEIHLVVDGRGNFYEDEFCKTISYFKNDCEERSNTAGQNILTNVEESRFHKVIKILREKDLVPVVVFSGSKRDCEVHAMQMANLEFNDDDDKDIVEDIFTNSINLLLNYDDQKLPQVTNWLPLLKRGIGVHHGGLLPPLREAVEILFADGLIKVLFATEEFARLHMTAHSVLLTTVYTFDGQSFHWLTAEDYTRLSGRAGRRGLDVSGASIVMVNQNTASCVGRSLLQYHPEPISSEFRLSYDTILNLLRVEQINPEFMIEHSFKQFQCNNKIPALHTKLQKAESDCQALEIPRQEEIESFYFLHVELETLNQSRLQFITDPKYILSCLQPGRLINVQNDDFDFGWCVVINVHQIDSSIINDQTKSTAPSYVVDALIHVASSTLKFTTSVVPPLPDETGEMIIVPASLATIQKISRIRIDLSSDDLESIESRMSVLDRVQQVTMKFSSGLPLLDPIEDMRILDEGFYNLLNRIEEVEESIQNHSLNLELDKGQLNNLYELYNRKISLLKTMDGAKQELKECKCMLLMDELHFRKQFLTALGHLSDEDKIELKGRVACELRNVDSILLTEIIFKDIFVNLDVPTTMALLSSFVCDEKGEEKTCTVSDHLSKGWKAVQDLARHIAKVSEECQLDVDEDAYLGQLKPFLMNVVYEWCNGAAFSRLCEMTSIFEGDIIRCIRRLVELLRQLTMAAKMVGDTELENKFDDGIKLLHRDIMMVPSLYS